MRLITKKHYAAFVAIAGTIHYLYGFLGYHAFDPPAESLWARLPILILALLFLPLMVFTEISKKNADRLFYCLIILISAHYSYLIYQTQQKMYYFDGAFLVYLASTALIFSKRYLNLLLALGSCSILFLIFSSTISYPSYLLAIHFIVFFFFLFIFQFEKINLFQKLEQAYQSANDSKLLIEKTYMTNIQAAHDLGSPITAIKAVADKIKYENPKLHHLLEESLQRITTISEDLLNIHKQGIKEVETDFFNLENNISQIVNEKRHEFRHIKNLFIYYHMTAPMLNEVKISKTDFYRIISNIVNNSLDAMKKNMEKRIKILIDPRNSNVNILISDNGEGIPEEHQSSVFLENVSYKKNGTGLGLSFCRKTARKWGGDLVIKKSGPSGTTLLLTLPYSSSD
jgi:signal transduction histidine kinase